MTPAEMLPILTEWSDTIRKAEADISEYIAPLRPIPESPLYIIPWNLMDAYTRAAMGFPASYILPENSRTAMHMLGNAVCPPVARDVLLAIKEAA